MAVPFSEAQGLNPSSIIELFELELNQLQHGSTEVYRFHSGTSLKSNGSVYWAGNEYTAFPIIAEGFEYQGGGQLPRPKLKIANLSGTITSLLLLLPNGLEGAKVTRIRTFARYIDNNNFPGDTNPFGTPDSSMKLPDEIFYIDRLATETRDVVEFELVAVFDLIGVRSPKRQCIPNLCQWTYKSAECSYTPAPSFTGTYSRSGTTVSVVGSGLGFTNGDNVYLDFTSGGVLDGGYIISNATASGFTVTTAASGTASGNVTGTQYYDANNNFVTASGSDSCGKQLTSCKTRFGENSQLPFGSFPGIGAFKQ